MLPKFILHPDLFRRYRKDCQQNEVYQVCPEELVIPQGTGRLDIKELNLKDLIGEARSGDASVGNCCLWTEWYDE